MYLHILDYCLCLKNKYSCNCFFLNDVSYTNVYCILKICLLQFIVDKVI